MRCTSRVNLTFLLPSLSISHSESTSHDYKQSQARPAFQSELRKTFSIKNFFFCSAAWARSVSSNVCRWRVDGRESRPFPEFETENEVGEQ